MVGGKANLEKGKPPEEVIAEFVGQPANHGLEADVRDFLDAALQRGWIVET